MYEFTPDTRLGISYKFRSMQKVKGNYTNTAYAMIGAPTVFSDGEASPDLPASVLISGYHRLNDKIGLSSSIRWTEWSKSFPEFIMKSDSSHTVVNQPYKWRDTWTVAVGADYYFNDNWTFRVGTAYDQSPAEDPANRSNRIPDSDRIWLSAGLSYHADNWQLDAGVAHLFMKKADIAMPRHSVPSEYSSYSNMYGLNFMYKF
jgi:long-chain fatty acid transport protein